jgi:tetratricopeptide (TPR) repeat protein
VSNLKNIVLLASFLGLAPNSFAHGDVHDRIVLLTQQISQSPSNASLYFNRADLYRTDGDYTNALADLHRTAKLDPTLSRVEFCIGRAHFEAGQPADALPPLNRYLAHPRRDQEAYTTRARVFAKLGQYQAATDDYATSIGFGSANPELFIERAAAYRAMNKPEEALRTLDSGIKSLGHLVTFELPAIEVEVSMKRFDAALARIDAVSARLQRKETWLMRRAEVLRQAGRDKEAQASYRDALAAIDRLPPSHRHTRATLELEGRIRAALGTTPAVALPGK